MTLPPRIQTPLLHSLTGYVNGAFLPPSSNAFAVEDPATGKAISHLSSYGEPETLAAVQAAEAALHKPTRLSERRGWLEHIAQAHVEHREILAQIITLENGKPLAEARGEVDYAAGFYTECARRMDCLKSRTLEALVKGRQWRIHARPAGVAGLIVPWNFPLAMLAKKVAAALAAGAPLVVKPSEKTPLSSIALFHILDGLGLPRGFVNLVFGDAPAIGRVLCAHPAVRVVSFTGSTAVGKLLSSQAAPHVKRMALELGGNAPFIVLPDADLLLAAEQLMLNKFRCAGQTCVCTNRVYVHRSIAADFESLLAQRIAALRVGAGDDPETTVGPLIDHQGYAKVSELVADAVSAGARVVCGAYAQAPREGVGLFYPPTLLGSVPSSARCVREEVFGPVVPLVTFDTDPEVAQAANATDYGLAAYVFSKDTTRAEGLIAQLRFGHVGLNCSAGPTPEAPFGGMKQSGLGREGGEEGIFEFVELQTVPSAVS